MSISRSTLQLGYASFTQLIAALSHPLPSCLDINLRHSQLGDLSTAQLQQVLQLISRNVTAVSSLDLRSNNLQDAGCALVASTLLSPTSPVQSINLWDNSITYRGARKLGYILASNTNCQVLNLGRNGLENDGTVALAKGLRQNSSLTHLNVRDSYIGDVGAAALATVPTLNVLDLSRNNVTDVGADALLFSNVRPTPFQTLNLSANEISNVNRIIEADTGEAKADTATARVPLSIVGILPENLSLSNQAGSGRSKVERVRHCWVQKNTDRGARIRADDPFGWEAR